MKRYEIFTLSEMVKNILPKSKKIKFNMFLVSNNTILDNEVEKMKSVLNYSDEFKEFENKRIKLCEKYAIKNENGEPIKENNVYKGLVGNENFNFDLKELRENYKDAVEEQEKIINEFNDLMNEDVDLDFEKIVVDLIPDDLIDGEQFALFKKCNMIEM